MASVLAMTSSYSLTVTVFVGRVVRADSGALRLMNGSVLMMRTSVSTYSRQGLRWLALSVLAMCCVSLTRNVIVFLQVSPLCESTLTCRVTL